MSPNNRNYKITKMQDFTKENSNIGDKGAALIIYIK